MLIEASSVSEKLELLFYPYEEFSALENMSIDHNLSIHQDDINKAIFRLYGWKPYAISIGFNQKYEELDLTALKKDGIDIIRRPTGGRAVFHGYELTYAAIFPKKYIKKSELYQKIHTVFKNSFQSIGIDTEFEKKNYSDLQFYKSNESVSCFNSSAKYELKTKKGKLVGSAQRVYKDAILQHGSILLSKDYFKLFDYLKKTENELKAIKELAEKKIAVIELDKSSKQFQMFTNKLKKELILEFSLDSLEENPFIHQRWSLAEHDFMIN